MGSIYRPSDYGCGSTDGTAFIQCVDGREPQIHEFWYLDLDGIIYNDYPTSHVEIPAGTVGDFVTDYLATNGRRIEIIGKISVNGRIKFLGLFDQTRGTRISFIFNLQARVEATG